LNRYRKKIDVNQPEIVDHFRKFGASVTHLHAVHGGVPDLLIGYQGKNYLIEVKSEKGNLNELQVAYFDNWNGQACVIRNKNEVEELLGVKGL